MTLMCTFMLPPSQYSNKNITPNIIFEINLEVFKLEIDWIQFQQILLNEAEEGGQNHQKISDLNVILCEAYDNIAIELLQFNCSKKMKGKTL